MTTQTEKNAVSMQAEADSAAEEAASKFLQDSQLKAPGLAAGYFFNFLDIISAQLKTAEDFILKDQKNVEHKYKTADVTIQVILPGKLALPTFENCVKELENSFRGTTFLYQQKRDYGINYRTLEYDGGRGITIVDLARPVMALKQYYEAMDPINTTNTANTELQHKWEWIQWAEIAAFRKTLEKLMDRGGYGGLRDKLDITPRF